MLHHATQRCVTKLWAAHNTTHVHARVCVGIACSGINSNIVQHTAPTKTMMLPPTSVVDANGDVAAKCSATLAMWDGTCYSALWRL